MKEKSDKELLRIALGLKENISMDYLRLSELFGFQKVKFNGVHEKSGGYLSEHQEKFLAFRELYARALAEDLELGIKITSVENAKNLALANLGGEKNEGFYVMFLNSAHYYIAFEKLFSGSIDRCHVHHRPLTQRMLELNASSLILVHNHPSGNAEFSYADRELTQSIDKCLQIFDARVIDHILVAGNKAVSMGYISG